MAIISLNRLTRKESSKKLWYPLKMPYSGTLFFNSKMTTLSLHENHDFERFQNDWAILKARIQYLPVFSLIKRLLRQKIDKMSH